MLPGLLPHAMDQARRHLRTVFGRRLTGAARNADVEQHEEAEREIHNAHVFSFLCPATQCKFGKPLTLRLAQTAGKENPAPAERGRVNGEI